MSGNGILKITVDAEVNKLGEVLAFIDAQLEAADCPMKPMTQIEIAVEELFVNIASYAYKPGSGTADICFEALDDPKGAVITFIDSGVPYDPLKKPDPDTKLTAAQRQIGGLGIYMVKKSMDDVAYRYEDGKNILSIKKLF